MPSYSTTGLIAAGVAGNVVSRAGAVIAQPAGGACWLDDTRIAYARKVGEPDVWALRAHDGIVETALDAKGATELRAGGGVWAAELGGPGVRSNRHPFLPLAGLRDVGPEGTLAYCRDRQDGRGLILRALDGATTVLVGETAACRDVQVHSAREATWIEGGRIRSTYGAPVTPEGRCGVPRTVRLDGQRWLLYWLEDAQGERLLLQPWNRPVGYVLTQPGQLRDGKADWPAFRPDLVVAVGELRACWAITEAEGLTSIRERAIDLTRPMVDLRRSAPAMVLPPFSRTLWLGYYKAQGRDGDYVEDALSNTNCLCYVPLGDTATGVDWRAELKRTCETLRRTNAYLFTNGHPDVIAAVAPYWDRVAGLLVSPEALGVSFEDVGTVNAQAGAARAAMDRLRLPRRPIIAYFDGVLDAQFVVPDTDAMALHCYLGPTTPTEPLVKLRAIIASQLARVPATMDVYLVQQSYDRNGAWTDIAALESMQWVPQAYVAQDARIGGIFYFAFARKGGVLTYPSLRTAHRAIFAANPGTPAIVPLTEDDVLNAPGVEILSWEPIGADKTAKLVRFTDRNNPQIGIIEVEIDDGYVRAAIENAAGRNRSSRRDRKVL